MLGQPARLRACNPCPCPPHLQWLSTTCLDFKWASPEKPASIVLRCRETALSSPAVTCQEGDLALMLTEDFCARLVPTNNRRLCQSIETQPEVLLTSHVI